MTTHIVATPPAGPRLEIGPGKKALPGFVSLDIEPRRGVDHVGDARRLPFETGMFELVYASHVIEHLPWYDVDQALAEWARVLRPGGHLEIWTVNAYDICKALVIYEETGEWTGGPLGKWKREWVREDPIRWCAGRLFCYSKSGRAGDPFWHHALFTPRSLQAAFATAGLVDVRRMDRAEVRSKDHGWINLGVTGRKPC